MNSPGIRVICTCFIFCAFVAQFFLFAFFPVDHCRTSSLNPQQKLAVLLVFNGKHDQEAENLLGSIQKNAPELLPHVTVCVSDLRGKLFARRHGLQYFEMDPIISSGKYMSRAMRIMNRRKLEAIVYLLQQDKNVLYTDTDVVFLSNPLPQIPTMYDLSMQNDNCSPPYDKSLLCSGFMYIKSNSATIKFFQATVSQMQQSIDDKKFGDQEAINLLLHRGTDISYFALDPCKFPNGCRYFDNSDPNCKASDALIIHNNYIIGLKRKHKRFKEHNLLFRVNNDLFFAGDDGEKT